MTIILKEMVQSRPVVGSEGVCQKKGGSGQRPERHSVESSRIDWNSRLIILATQRASVIATQNYIIRSTLALPEYSTGNSIKQFQPLQFQRFQCAVFLTLMIPLVPSFRSTSTLSALRILPGKRGVVFGIKCGLCSYPTNIRFSR